MAQKALLLILVLVLSFIGWQTGKKMRVRLGLVKEIASLETEIKGLQGKNTELLDFLAYVKSDAFLEREARMRFGLGKPGEKTIVIVPSEEGKDKENGNNQEEQKSLSNPQRWWRYFTKTLKH